PAASSSITARSSDGVSVRRPDLRRRVRDVPGQRALAHAPGALARRAGDPAVPVGGAPYALPPDHRRGMHERDAARAAGRRHGRRRRRCSRAAPAHPRSRVAGDGLRATGYAPGGPARVRLDREEPHAPVVRALTQLPAQRLAGAVGDATTPSASRRAAVRNRCASMNGAPMSWTPSGNGPAPASPVIGTERTGRPTNDQGCVKTPRCPRVTTSTSSTIVVRGAPIGGAG